MDQDKIDRLNALKQKYVIKLRDFSSYLVSIQGELGAIAQNPTRRAEVEEAAHRVAGAAGTFGFGEISVIAARLEDWATDQSASLDQAHEDIDRLVDVIAKIEQDTDS